MSVCGCVGITIKKNLVFSFHILLTGQLGVGTSFGTWFGSVRSLLLNSVMNKFYVMSHIFVHRQVKSLFFAI